MGLKLWPQEERPREKLICRGAEQLSDAELLALLLRSGRPGLDVVAFARELLSDFGSLATFLESDIEQMCQVAGLGPAKFALLKASLELGRRYLGCHLAETDVLNNPTLTREYIKSYLRGYDQEVFACLFMDARYQVLGFEKLFYGTVNAASVYPREVVKKSLQYNAVAVILAHNHPSGSAEPSDADIEITQTLQQALNLIDVVVTDHIVVGHARVVSFAERGYLTRV